MDDLNEYLFSIHILTYRSSFNVPGFSVSLFSCVCPQHDLATSQRQLIILQRQMQMVSIFT
jgi:hypothetical protein